LRVAFVCDCSHFAAPLFAFALSEMYVLIRQMQSGRNTNGKGVTRHSAKRSRIIGTIRQEIIDGALPPGSRLPTRTHLEARFGVSSVTVQRAIDTLIQDGFIYAHHRQGTFVAEHPPHLSHYGLIIPHGLGDPRERNHYYEALSNEAAALGSNSSRQITVYRGMDERAAGHEFARLCSDLEAHRVGGLIFSTSPHNLTHTPLLTLPGVPRVAMMPEMKWGIPAVLHDYNGFLIRARQYLAARGRSRIAYLLYTPVGVDGENSTWISGHPVSAPSYWTQYAAPWPTQAACNAVELLLRAPANERPDGLIITDDNLVPSATAGLLAAGVRVPQEIEVVAHCNFPWPTHSAVAIKRLGFDARATLERCLQILDTQRKGHTPPPFTLIPAVFEEEVIS
jgi:DNA-binding transcriptional regulator YhcF (GntR family)